VSFANQTRETSRASCSGLPRRYSRRWNCTRRGETKENRLSEGGSKKKAPGGKWGFLKEGKQSVVKLRQFIHSLWALASLSRKLHGDETERKPASSSCPFPEVARLPPPVSRFLAVETVLNC